MLRRARARNRPGRGAAARGLLRDGRRFPQPHPKSVYHTDNGCFACEFLKSQLHRPPVTGALHNRSARRRQPHDRDGGRRPGDRRT
jgi:hypothetical protein